MENRRSVSLTCEMGSFLWKSLIAVEVYKGTYYTPPALCHEFWVHATRSIPEDSGTWHQWRIESLKMGLGGRNILWSTVCQKQSIAAPYPYGTRFQFKKGGTCAITLDQPLRRNNFALNRFYFSCWLFVSCVCFLFTLAKLNIETVTTGACAARIKGVESQRYLVMQPNGTLTSQVCI